MLMWPTGEINLTPVVYTILSWPILLICRTSFCMFIVYTAILRRPLIRMDTSCIHHTPSVKFHFLSSWSCYPSVWWWTVCTGTSRCRPTGRSSRLWTCLKWSYFCPAVQRAVHIPGRGTSWHCQSCSVLRSNREPAGPASSHRGRARDGTASWHHHPELWWAPPAGGLWPESEFLKEELQFPVNSITLTVSFTKLLILLLFGGEYSYQCLYSLVLNFLNKYRENDS